MMGCVLRIAHNQGLPDEPRSLQSQTSLTLAIPPPGNAALASEVEGVKPEWEPGRRPVVWNTAAGRSSHVRSDKFGMGYTATLALGLGRLLSISHSGIRSQWVLLAIGWRRATFQHRTG